MTKLGAVLPCAPTPVLPQGCLGGRVGWWVGQLETKLSSAPTKARLKLGWAWQKLNITESEVGGLLVFGMCLVHVMKN